MWPGYVKGAVLTVEDALALAIVTTHRRPRGLPPLAGFIILYMLAVALSIGMSDEPIASAFYDFQLLRFLVIVIAVSKIAGDTRALLWLGMGLSAGIIYEAAVTTHQALIGTFRPPGSMQHPNQLGMMTHFVILPILGMLLAGYRNRLLMLGVGCSFVVVTLGESRATIGFVAFGALATLVLSMWRRKTPHKKRMFWLAFIGLAIASPFLLSSLGNRLATHAQDGDEERAAFERAAKMMWSDHPLGVGANEYVMVANIKGYSVRAGVTWSSGSRGTNVHNTYLLVAAETGWFGLITYIALLGAAILAGLRFAFGNRADPRGEIALGSSVAIAMMALHSQYEWITLTYEVQYVFAISVGIISGLVRVRAIERNQAIRARAEARFSNQPPVGQAIS
jgi:O-antigen ligase